MTEQAPSKASNRRSKPVYLVLGTLLAVVAPTSIWLQKKYGVTKVVTSPGYSPPPKPTEPTELYYSFSDLGERVFDEKLRKVLTRLEDDCNDIESEVNRIHQQLQDSDPRLAAALKDPLGIPFDNGNAPSSAELLAPCRSIVDGIVTDFLKSNRDRSELAERIAPSLRDALNAFFSDRAIPPAVYPVLREAVIDGIHDPIVLAIVTFDTSVIRYKGQHLPELLFEKRNLRPLSVPETVLTYLSLASSALILDRHIQGKSTAEGIQVFADAWKWIVTGEVEPAYWHCLFRQTLAFSRSLPGYGNADLLIAMDNHNDPPVPAEIKHFIAYRIYAELVKSYYESKSAIITPKNDPQRYLEVCDKVVTHLSRAWTLAPQCDVLPSLLMEWEFNHGKTGLRGEEWFRHAIAVVSDSVHAYRHFNKFVLKEDANPENWLAFAERCAETSASNSTAFFRFPTTLKRYVEHQEYRFGLGSEPRLRRVCKRVVSELKRYSSVEPHPLVNSDMLALVVYLLWQGGEFEDLSWLLSIHCDLIPCSKLHLYRMHVGETQLVTDQCISASSDSWRIVHKFLTTDSRLLSVEDLDSYDATFARLREIARAEAAIIQPESFAKNGTLSGDSDREGAGEATESTSQLLSLISDLQLKANLVRRLREGEEILFSEDELHMGYTLVKSWGEGKVVSKAVSRLSALDRRDVRESSAVDDINQVVSPDSSDDTAENHSITTGEAEVGDQHPESSVIAGAFRIDVDMQQHDIRLVLPIQVDPPFVLSADIELLHREGSSKDEYGAGLMPGPCYSDGFRVNDCCPTISALPELGGYFRDYLPNPLWSGPSQGSPLLVKKASEAFTACNLKLEILADGYRSYIDHELWEEVRMPMDTYGWIQVGRYCQMAVFGNPKPFVHYEISNIRLQAIKEGSLNGRDPISRP